jgi:integron integrase
MLWTHARDGCKLRSDIGSGRVPTHSPLRQRACGETIRTLYGFGVRNSQEALHRCKIRRKHYSIRTEQVYLQWVKRYILFHGKKHPKELGAAQVVAFLNYLAVERSVAASTQNQALNALVFLYKQVLGRDDLLLDDIKPAKRPEKLPSVFDRGEIERLFRHLEGTPKLVAAVLYGSGVRLIEGLRLRIQDIEFERSQIVVRNGKGAKDRVTLLPSGLVQPIRDQMTVARRLHEEDLAAGLGEVYLPYALARKYPNAARKWGWQYLFPAGSTSTDPRSGKTRRHHLGESSIQRAVKNAMGAGGIHKHGNTHIRDLSFGRRVRHTHSTGAAWAQRCEDNHDLHPCDEQRASGGQEPLDTGARLLILSVQSSAMVTHTTLHPGQKGTKRLVDKYGDRLVCDTSTIKKPAEDAPPSSLSKRKESCRRQTFHCPGNEGRIPSREGLG